MSLFPSAFDAGLPGPSKTASLGNPTGASKRKRASLGGKEDQLRSTTANLSKLMDKLDRGEIKEKIGRESLGQMGKKRKSAFDDEPAPSPRGKQGKQQHAGGKGGKPQQNQPKKQQQQQQNQPKSTPTKGKQAEGGKGKDNKSKSKSKGDRPAPVELPMPEIPTAEVSDAGLTDMQRQMRSKLEGARFRWINEQLYSTPSTDAVAMMKKDPKIFADVSSNKRIAS